ncbi:MAG: class I SAM-dependent methyltransferase [Rhodobacteraceae bacterium]|nr:class I SAM-dependent methyltransferase [Paracoccaceae bacterium]
MIKRRTLMGTGAAITGAFTSMFAGRKAEAAKSAKNSATYPEGTIAPRGSFGVLERLPALDLEARQDFLTAFRAFANTTIARNAQARANELVKGAGKTPTELNQAEAIELLQDDPLVAMTSKSWLTAQQLMWDDLKNYFEANADRYYSEMEAVDNRGPGTLELNPDMDIPEYTRHEIHIQPGGYVGHPFAGHIYHYGTNAFYTGRNYQDELHRGAASKMPVPADGKVKRILDVGCGIGQMSMALKERFPDAEVWGLDIGGPMVRYAHLRAVERGVDVNFAQRLAEDTKFPDGYFDIVTSYIMYHEVDPTGTHASVKEAWRVLRPGGVYYPLDFKLKDVPPATAYRHYRGWMDHRWNNEVWSPKFRANGLPDIIRKAGFDLNEEGPELLRGFGVLNATKPA